MDTKSVDYSELRAIFADFVKYDATTQVLSFWQVITMGLARAAGKQVPDFTTGLNLNSEEPTEPLPDCGNNVSCHLYNFVEWQVPLQDSDGDWFASSEVRRFRGTDWRGVDCNDEVSLSGGDISTPLAATMKFTHAILTILIDIYIMHS